jgi:hypothetical protein
MASHGNHLDAALAARGLDVTIVEEDPAVAGSLLRRGVQVRTDALATGGAFRAVLDHYHAAHVADLDGYLARLASSLAPDGIARFHVDHLLSTVVGGQVDSIRHGHFAYFSLLALEAALQRQRLVVTDVVRRDEFGGSLWIDARHRGHGTSAPGVERVRTDERRAGLRSLDVLQDWGRRGLEQAAALRAFLEERRAAGDSVIGYGAPSRATTLLGGANVGPDLLPLIVDRSPAKHGRRLAGSGIPIAAPTEVARRRPSHLLILTWHLAEEVMDQMREIRDWGGRFVVPLPSLEVR